MQRVLALVLAMAVPLSAANTDWQQVVGLPMDARVRVGPSPQGRVVGTMRAADAQTLTVQTRQGDRVLQRGEVRIVRVRTAKARGRNVAVNAAIAAGIWAGFVGIVAAIVGASDDDGILVPLLLSGMGFFGGITAGVTALVPGYETVYRAP